MRLVERFEHRRRPPMFRDVPARRCSSACRRSTCGCSSCRRTTARRDRRRACGSSSPARRRCRRRCSRRSAAVRPHDPRALRHERDADERRAIRTRASGAPGTVGAAACPACRCASSTTTGADVGRWRDRRAAGARAQRVRRLLAAARGHRRGLRRRLVPDRRPRRARRRTATSRCAGAGAISSSPAASTSTRARSRSCCSRSPAVREAAVVGVADARARRGAGRLRRAGRTRSTATGARRDAAGGRSRRSRCRARSCGWTRCRARRSARCRSICCRRPWATGARVSPAAWSLAALLVAIVVSCTSRINVGVLAIAFAWLIGVYAAGWQAGAVLAGFPASLFLTLAGVTLLFALAEANGTLGAAGAARGRAGARRRAACCRCCSSLLALRRVSTVGPGAIASVALVAPLAMAIGARAGVLAVADRADGGQRRQRRQPLADQRGRGRSRTARWPTPGSAATSGKVWLANFARARAGRRRPRTRCWRPGERVLRAARARRRAIAQTGALLSGTQWLTIAVVALWIAASSCSGSTSGSRVRGGGVLVLVRAADEAAAIRRDALVGHRDGHAA